MKKHTISLLMAAAMTLSLLTTGAFAAETPAETPPPAVTAPVASVRAPENHTYEASMTAENGEKFSIEAAIPHYYGSLVLPIPFSMDHLLLPNSGSEMDIDVIGLVEQGSSATYKITQNTLNGGWSQITELIPCSYTPSTGRFDTFYISPETATVPDTLTVHKMFTDGGLKYTQVYFHEDLKSDYAASICSFDLVLTQADIDTYLATGEVFGYNWPGLRELLIDESAASTATPSPCAATLDGKAINLNAYLIPEVGGNSSNYVRLRDVAYLLNGTKAQFEVKWDKNTGIAITTGQPYTSVGGEFQSKGDGNKPYTANTSAITVNGKTVDLTAYTIGGNNYFKLRDLGAVLGVNVSWNKSAGIIIDSTKPYTGV